MRRLAAAFPRARRSIGLITVWRALQLLRQHDQRHSRQGELPAQGINDVHLPDILPQLNIFQRNLQPHGQHSVALLAQAIGLDGRRLKHLLMGLVKGHTGVLYLTCQGAKLDPEKQKTLEEALLRRFQA